MNLLKIVFIILFIIIIILFYYLFFHLLNLHFSKSIANCGTIQISQFSWQMAHTNTAFSYTKLFFFQLTAFKINKSRDAPEHLATENLWPKMAQTCIFRFSAE